jgi:hypothetical protein
MPANSALQSILTEAGLAIAPLRSVNTSDKAVTFFRQLGYEIPPGAFGSSLSQLGAQAGELVNAVQRLLQQTDEAAVIAAVAEMMGRLGTTVNAINDVLNAVKGGGGAGIPGINDLPRRLTDFLILDYLERQKAQSHAILHTLGLIEDEPGGAPGTPKRLINWEKLGDFLTKTGQHFNALYQWDSNFDTDKFLFRLEKVMRAAALPGGLYPMAESTRLALGNASTNLKELRFPIFQGGLTPETYAQFGVTFSPAEANGGKKKGIAMLPYLMGTAAFNFSVCDKGELGFESSGDIKGVGLILRPPFDAEGILNLVGAFNAALSIRQKQETAQELILIGTAGGTRFALQGLGMRAFIANPQGKLDVGWEGQIEAVRLVIAPGEGDGFLAQILSGLRVEAEAKLGLGFSLLAGFYITGGAKLAIEIPTHIDLGPVHILSARLALLLAAEKLRLEAGATFKFDLGPLKAVVENIGLGADLEFKQGNLGPANLAVGFKPPNGVGLSIDAGVVKGGGYLYFDFENEEYAGALELVFSGFLTLKAIGLITTKMPDGSKGFSLLIIITAEFGTGIQLGFGFTLLGVGGLLGLNRTMKLDVLAQGIRTGSVENILFPRDVIANAPRIISDLRAIFPPQEGRFLIGPMAKLGWGTPTLISLSLGVIIEIPGNIAILGVFKVALPAEEAALLILQVSFIGALEFDKKRIWFFATLFGSRVLFFTIEGEMGLLMDYGDQPNFVLSVGGFHPRFTPPPLPFPSPQRIAFDIANTPVYQIRVEGYFAVTSNTVQFGARANLRLGLDDFGISGHIAFDALFQFSPFYFIIGISASVSLKVFGIGLFSIRLEFELSGPEPWRAKGSGYLSLLFFEISADFDITWGEDRRETLPSVKALQFLDEEINKAENWTAALPAGNNLLVSLRKLEETEGLVLHPLGVLKFTQRAIPLDIRLDKVGAPKVDDFKKLTLDTDPASPWAKVNDPRENFAIAQFQDMKDSEKLTRPSFQLEKSGAELSVPGKATRTGMMTKRTVRYEQIIIDTNYRRFTRRFFRFFGVLFNQFMRGNAVALSPLSKEYARQLDPWDEPLVLKQEGFAVVTNHNNKAVSQIFASETEARDFLHTAAAMDANLATTLDVVPQFEVNLN